MELPNVYTATITRVVDGDTLEADIDLGFSLCLRKAKLRLLGINAPEMSTTEGKAACAYLKGLVYPTPSIAIIDSVKNDKYGGRYDAKVWTGVSREGESLSDRMVKAGHAVVRVYTVGTEPAFGYMDRPANQYDPTANAGWEWRIVSCATAGTWKAFVGEVLWVNGKVSIVRPLPHVMSSSVELLRGSMDSAIENINKARSRPVLVCDAALVDWLGGR